MADSSSAGAAASTTSLRSYTPVPPNAFPLLVSLPSSTSPLQIDVPLDSTVSNISSLLAPHGVDLSLSFAGEPLAPSTPLLDTNIVAAYEHAGGLLRVIEDGDLDTHHTGRALDSACAVVEKLSNGVRDMEALCDAATNTASDARWDRRFDSPRPPGSASLTPGRRQPFGSISGGSFGPIDDLLADDVRVAPGDAESLVRGLSRRLPQLFTPEAVREMCGEDQVEQPALQRKASGQPSLIAIRQARRQAKERREGSAEYTDCESSGSTRPDGSGGIMNVDGSTLGQSTVDLGETAGELGRGDLGGEKEKEAGATTVDKARGTIFAGSGNKTNWVQDVMTTWEVGLVRKSGMLESEEGGAELSNYLQSLEKETAADQERERRAFGKNARSDHRGPTDSIEEPEGDSEDSDGGKPEFQGATSDHRPLHNTAPVQAPKAGGTADNLAPSKEQQRQDGQDGMQGVTHPHSQAQCRTESHPSTPGQGQGKCQNLPPAQSPALSEAEARARARSLISSQTPALQTEAQAAAQSQALAQARAQANAQVHGMSPAQVQTLAQAQARAQSLAGGRPPLTLQERVRAQAQAQVAHVQARARTQAEAEADRNEQQQPQQSLQQPSQQRLQRQALSHQFPPPAGSQNAASQPAFHNPLYSPQQAQQQQEALMRSQVSAQQGGQQRGGEAPPPGGNSNPQPNPLPAQQSSSKYPPRPAAANASHGCQNSVSPPGGEFRANSLANGADSSSHMATPIAPAPNSTMNTGAISGAPGIASSTMPQLMGTTVNGVPQIALQQQVLAFAGLPPVPVVPMVSKPAPKKRGRKRKNPGLSEEERALVRKSQNRESAKLSRIRRKVIEAEFEDQIADLVHSNQQYADHVAMLSNKLKYMESLLTVTVAPVVANSGDPSVRKSDGSLSGSGTNSDSIGQLSAALAHGGNINNRVPSNATNSSKSSLHSSGVDPKTFQQNGLGVQSGIAGGQAQVAVGHAQVADGRAQMAGIHTQMAGGHTQVASSYAQLAGGGQQQPMQFQHPTLQHFMTQQQQQQPVPQPQEASLLSQQSQQSQQSRLYQP